MDKPDVDSIEGLSPAISIDQKSTSNNPRSTVGTITEIYDYLRLLFARAAIPHCPKCGREIVPQTIDESGSKITARKEGTKIQIMAPVIRSKKGEYSNLLSALKQEGFIRVRVDGEIYNLDEDEIELEKTKKHNIDIVIDRIVVKDSAKARIIDSVQTAHQRAEGRVSGDIVGSEDKLFSERLNCPDCT